MESGRENRGGGDGNPMIVIMGNRKMKMKPLHQLHGITMEKQLHNANVNRKQTGKPVQRGKPPINTVCLDPVPKRPRSTRSCCHLRFLDTLQDGCLSLRESLVEGGHVHVELGAAAHSG